jgi:hypothetical protein
VHHARGAAVVERQVARAVVLRAPVPEAGAVQDGGQLGGRDGAAQDEAGRARGPRLVLLGAVGGERGQQGLARERDGLGGGELDRATDADDGPELADDVVDPERPQRQSATTSRPGSISVPSWSSSRNGPRTTRGPSR